MANIFAHLRIFFAGYPGDSFQKRQIMVLTAWGAALGIAATVINLATRQGWVITVTSAAAGGLLVLVYGYARKSQNMNPILAIIVLVGAGVAVVSWFSSDGIFGSSPYLFYLVMSWLLAAHEQRRHVWFVGGFSLLLALLIVLQLFYPGLITHYHDVSAHWQDLLVGISVTLIFQVLFFSGLRKQFDTEQTLLRQKNLKLLALNEELVRMKNAAEASLVQRSDFLAAMSHELRTPLASVVSGVRLLRDGPESLNRNGILEHMERSALQLLRRIDDLLVVRAQEVGDVSIVEGPVDLAECAKDLQSTFATAASAKGLSLSLAIDPALPRVILSDSARLDQILSNLLSNAIKYTLVGSVELHIVKLPAGEVQFSVKDTGRGIPEAERDSLFLPFSRISNMSKRVHGTGLGLTVSLSLARKLGGSLSLAESSPTGSVFCLRMPLREYSADDAA